MLALSNADGVVWSVVGLFVVVALIVLWRVAVYDPSIRRVRFGVFYERERTPDDEPEDEPEHEARPSDV